MKEKTKNKLKAIVAKSKKEQIREVMLTYNWNKVKLTIIKVGKDTFASIRERGTEWDPSTTRTVFKSIANSHQSSLKGRLAIFAMVKLVDSDKTEELNTKEGDIYAKYFGKYVTENKLAVFL